MHLKHYYKKKSVGITRFQRGSWHKIRIPALMGDHQKIPGAEGIFFCFLKNSCFRAKENEIIF